MPLMPSNIPRVLQCSAGIKYSGASYKNKKVLQLVFNALLEILLYSVLRGKLEKLFSNGFQ